MIKKSLLVLIVLFLTQYAYSNRFDGEWVIPNFDIKLADKFADKILVCLSHEYPSQEKFVQEKAGEMFQPSQVHPVFYGCQSWQGAVKGYWSLVRLLKMYPDLEKRDSIIEFIDAHLNELAIEQEIKFFAMESSFCTQYSSYGYAWFLKFNEELMTWTNPLAKRWGEALSPLTSVILRKQYEYLLGLYYPIRNGSQSNTAFALSFTYDYAKEAGDIKLEAFVSERALFYFENDNSNPSIWEPESDDLFSSTLIEAELMSKVMTDIEFIRWFKNFMPDFPSNLQAPAVIERFSGTNHRILDGLNINRSWCLFEIARDMPSRSPIQEEMWLAGMRHASDALPIVTNEALEHVEWLIPYAIYMYSKKENID